MFQFPGFPSFRISHLQCEGFPHSDICGLTLVCNSPQLFAAYHVLRRLWEPRHPPYALNSLPCLRLIPNLWSYLFFLLNSFLYSLPLCQWTLCLPSWFPSTTSISPLFIMLADCGLPSGSSVDSKDLWSQESVAQILLPPIYNYSPDSLAHEYLKWTQYFL